MSFMSHMDGWSLALLAIAAFLATSSLAKLMRGRYQALIGRLRREWRREQDRKAAEERRQRREERKQQLREQIQQRLDEAAEEAA